MWTRRQCLALVLPGPSMPASRPLAWTDLPPRAQGFARDLALTPERWLQWQADRRQSLDARILAGSAEHVTYYFLQSRAFTARPPLAPLALAQHKGPMPEAAQHRAHDFDHATEARDDRHRLVRALEHWPLPRCFAHTMDFLRAKESAPLDDLYFQRGLSSDSAPAQTQILDDIPGEPADILLAGPGLDLTRRENFTDDLPLRSHQLHHLRQRYPQARLHLADVRPEVIQHLGARRVDVTTEVAAEARYDLIVATNLLLYFEDRELLTALAAFARALKPSGVLLHNDQRFAAKLFGEACGIPVKNFTARETSPRRWDRAVLHRKEST